MFSRTITATLFVLLTLSSAQATHQLTALQWNTTTPLILSLHFNEAPPLPHLLTLENPQRLIIDLPDTTQQLPAPAAPFPEEVEELSIGEHQGTTRLVLKLRETLTPQLEQQGNELYLSLNSPQKSKKTAHELLNLSLEQTSVAQVLQQISHHAGQNLILNGKIDGTTSLQLHQVHWRDAFNLLIRQHQLQLQEENGILIVTPLPSTIPAATEPSPPALPPLLTEMIPLHYADAADLKQTLESNQKNPLLSERGVLGVDERTNTLLVQDDEPHLTRIHSLIKQLDTPSKQVLIESRIIIAADDFSHELGARLGITHLEATQQQWGFSLSGNSEAANSALSGTTPGLSSNNNRLAVNLPVTSAAGSIGLTLAKLSSGSLIDLELSAAQLEGKTEIIANPRLITSNGYEASIQQGVQIPYRSDTLSGGTDVSFKDAVMELKVTPQITPDHQIILTLQVKKDAVGSILCNNCEPSVDTREVKTRVMIGDGETLVIGGIYEERKSDSENRVPGLADLPVIGALFRNNSKTHGKDELLIFITPSILQPPTATTKVTERIEQNQTKYLSRRVDGGRQIHHW